MSKAKSVDLVVIGAGPGGMAAAAAAASKGKRVIVLDRLPHIGGATSIFRCVGADAEAALNEIDGECLHNPYGPFRRLELIGKFRRVESDALFEARGGPLDQPVAMPYDLKIAREALRTAFPENNYSIDKYFRELEMLVEAMRDVERKGSSGIYSLIGLLFSPRSQALHLMAKQNVAQKFNAAFGRSEPIKFVLGAMLPYFDDDPLKTSYFAYAGALARFIESGSYVFDGGAADMMRELKARIEKAGGEVICGARVCKVLLDKSRAAAGVTYVLEQSNEEHEVLASDVFAGAAPAAVAEMLPVEERAEFQRRYSRFAPSISLFSISFTLSRPAFELGISSHTTFIYPEGMERFGDWPERAAVFANSPNGEMPPYVLMDHGHGLRGQNSAGPHRVTMLGVDRLQWRRAFSESSEHDFRQFWIADSMNDLDRKYRGFAESVIRADMTTAVTLNEHLGSPHGSVGGFRPTTARLLSTPPSARTNIDGLWLSSSYTVQGGLVGAIQGGLMAVDEAFR